MKLKEVKMSEETTKEKFPKDYFTLKCDNCDAKIGYLFGYYIDEDDSKVICKKCANKLYEMIDNTIFSLPKEE
jgi:hypothetical protein